MEEQQQEAELANDSTLSITAASVGAVGTQRANVNVTTSSMTASAGCGLHRQTAATHCKPDTRSDRSSSASSSSNYNTTITDDLSSASESSKSENETAIISEDPALGPDKLTDKEGIEIVKKRPHTNKGYQVPQKHRHDPKKVYKRKL